MSMWGSFSTVAESPLPAYLIDDPRGKSFQ